MPLRATGGRVKDFSPAPRACRKWESLGGIVGPVSAPQLDECDPGRDLIAGRGEWARDEDSRSAV
jgi:hypothetical protein